MDLEPGEITSGRHVQCTSPLRTWFDLAGFLDRDVLVIAGDFLLTRRGPLATFAELDSFLAAKAAKPGYRKAMRARILIRANTDSPKDAEVRLLQRRHGLPEPGVNMPLFDETGRWIQDPDMSYEREMVAIQYDGGHHASAAPRAVTRVRKALMERGWTPEPARRRR